MTLPKWLSTTLHPDDKTAPDNSKSGNTGTGEQKVGTSESQAQQGFQEVVPTVPTVPTKKQSPLKIDQEEEKTPPGLPDDLRRRVAQICQLERWDAATRIAWQHTLRRQLDLDRVPVAELVSCLDAHLTRHHTHPADREAFEERAAIMEHDGGLPRARAETLAAQEGNCMNCAHWLGVQAYSENRYQALTAAGLPGKPRSVVMGQCRHHHRPWRVSNLPSDPGYQHWHFLGICHYQPLQHWEQAA
ncbi:hypothetical protein [Chromobacterium haemolyticum]|uniref:hypothetical protein n=1 Tax=Chromobacterium haemolyticum TaxID=394935 RepID=UPI0012F8BA9F|nr:hypothetical protein [Chromobacterium haemolyticum]